MPSSSIGLASRDGPRREFLSSTLGPLIRLAVELRRLENGAAVLVASPLSKAFAESLSVLSGDEPLATGQALPFLRSFNEQVGAAIQTARATVADQAIEIAGYQSERTAKILSRATGNVFASDTVSRDRLREIFTNDAFEGLTADQWFNRLEAQTKVKTQRILDEYLTKGLNAGEIKQKIDELVVRPAMRQTEALTRTITSNMSVAAQWETGEANPHLTRGYRLLFTLDRRTSLICIAWSRKSKDRLYPYAPDSPRPPFHFNCRTIIAPVLIGREHEHTVEADEWLTKQSEKTQDAILGPQRAELFRKGKLQLDELIRSDNTIATIPELRGVAATFTL